MRQRQPDMNSLVGLGACASFAMSAFAAARPSLGWPTFFEEPAMLLGCVLLGRALEERAKLMATSDLSALQVGLLLLEHLQDKQASRPALVASVKIQEILLI